MNTTITHIKGSHPRVITNKIYLTCGILSSLLYLAMNIFIPILFPGYSYASHTVSELSAIGAPTRTLWVILASMYTLLIAVFGWGLYKSAGHNRPLRIAGLLLIIYAVTGIYWPPMHQREVLAAGGGTLTDTLHIVFTMVTVSLMLLVIGFSSASFGIQFRIYSIATILLLIGFGALTGLDAPQLQANLPTPWIGVWERISIGVYMVWIAALSIIVLRKKWEM